MAMRRIGLVLSGGMGKGAYQIGALSAIGEYFDPSDFTYVSAASIGALNAYAFLTGRLHEARRIWESIDLRGNSRFVPSVLKSTLMEEVIQRIATDTRIASAFYVPLLDIDSRELQYHNFSAVPVAQIQSYLSASIAMPLYSSGIQIGSKSLYDGALVDNIPVYPVLKENPDYMICIYFDDVHYVFENHEVNSRVIKLTFPDNKIISNSVCIQHDSIMRMLEEGYRRTRMILDAIFSEGLDDLSLIYQKIADMDVASQRSGKLRITGDVMVTNFNRLARRLIRHDRVALKPAGHS